MTATQAATKAATKSATKSATEAATEADTSAATLRVMTFNVRGFYHPDDGDNIWQNREAINVATIRRAAPHLIGMQEVQTGNLKAYDRLLPEYHWTAWPEYGDAPPFEWPAIYWDPRVLQPLDSGGFWLSEMPDRHSRSWDTDCIRSATWLKFRHVATGARIVHLNTHLDHISERARIEGTRLIVARLDDLQSGGAAAIVTADFNDRPGSATHRAWLDAGFADAHIAAGHGDDPERDFTYHGWRGTSFRREGTAPVRIDWVLLRPGATAARVESCEILRDAAPPVYPSDHYPVLAQIALV
jgi:endonuclease/exonuclease/phosphatase family metal-dependent hydrolase